MSAFNKLCLSCFAAVTCCAVQASSITIAMWIMGSRKKVNNDELPPSSHIWCRLLLFSSVIFCGLSFSCVISIIDFIISARVASFACLSWLDKILVIAGDVVAALWGVAVFTAGSYIALF